MKAIHGFFLSLIMSVAGVTHAADDGKRDCRFPEGPSNEGSVFEPAPWPSIELDTFASGRLGLIRPTYDHFYLFIAYRNLLGLPISAGALRQMRPFDPCWTSDARYFHGYDPSAEVAFRDAFHQWERVRREISENKKTAVVEPFRVTTSYGSYEYKNFLNCNADAFRNAAKVLDNRRALYGRTPELLLWAEAQDQVFANCKSPVGPPPIISSAAPRWLQLDRSYQIAAAHFYAGNYPAAINAFDKISATSDSPWREMAPYLAARALIRSATTSEQRHAKGGLDSEILEQAEKRLIALLARPIEKGLRNDATRLLQFVQIRVQPRLVLLQIEKRMALRELPESIGQDVRDFWSVFATEEDDDNVPFSNWVSTMRLPPDASNAHAYERWVKSGDLPWLIAALQLADTKSAWYGEILAAAKKVPRGSPAYVSARFHLARLTKSTKVSIQLIKEMLKLPKDQMPPQDANAFRRLGLQRGGSLADFVDFSQREISMSWSGGILPNVDSDSVETFNRGLPLDTLVSILASKDISQPFRQELTRVVFTRAFVLSRWDVIEKLSPQVKKMLPESAGLVDDMNREVDEKTRKAIGAMLLARYPGMVGSVTDEIYYEDRLDSIARANMHRSMKQEGTRDNWWCGLPNEVYFVKKGGAPEKERRLASFLTKKQVDALRLERQKLEVVANGTDYLSELLMDWAREHPKDARLPQGLHMLVRSSRGGCVDGHYSGVMFRRLHKFFPESIWTKRTTVHY